MLVDEFCGVSSLLSLPFFHSFVILAIFLAIEYYFEQEFFLYCENDLFMDGLCIIEKLFDGNLLVVHKQE